MKPGETLSDALRFAGGFTANARAARSDRAHRSPRAAHWAGAIGCTEIVSDEFMTATVRP